MNHKNCAANIFVGVGGYKNIASICRCASRIRIDLWDDRLISCDVIAKNSLIDRLVYKNEHELQLILKPKDINKVCCELLNLYEFCKNAEMYADADDKPEKNEERKAHKRSDDFVEYEHVEEREKKTQAYGMYTAEYFMNEAELAINDTELPPVEKRRVIKFVSMIAENAAYFANEKEISKKLIFVPEFVKAVTEAREEDGQIEINGNIFASADKNNNISVQYQKNENEEGYNLLVTDIRNKNMISYTGCVCTACKEKPLLPT